MQILSNPGKEIFVGVRGLQAGIICHAAQPVILRGEAFRLDHILHEGCLVVLDQVCSATNHQEQYQHHRSGDGADDPDGYQPDRSQIGRKSPAVIVYFADGDDFLCPCTE